MEKRMTSFVSFRKTLLLLILINKNDNFCFNRNNIQFTKKNTSHRERFVVKISSAGNIQN